MKIINSLCEWRERRREMPVQTTVGLVATMGNLHQGHIRLLQRAKQENDISVLTIFVNPTQFNDKTDYEKYPRTLEKDMILAQQAGVDYLLIPSSDEIYPDGYHYQISERSISKILEGKFRENHFEGVLTVVMKLLLLVKPRRAYFGEKDYQQLTLVKGMVDAFFLDIEVVPCETVRLESGLALSSRNSRLNEAQLAQSVLLSQLLLSSETETAIKTQLEKNGFEVEYVEQWNGRRLAAVKIGDVRLIDNCVLPED